MNLDFIRRDTTRLCVAIGEEGTLSWNGVTSDVRLVRPGQTEMMLHDERPDRDASYTAQLDAFLASVESGAPVVVNGADGVAALEIVEAVRRSHAANGLAVAPGAQK